MQSHVLYQVRGCRIKLLELIVVTPGRSLKRLQQLRAFFKFNLDLFWASAPTNLCLNAPASLQIKLCTGSFSTADANATIYREK
jgi:hypothetical protein